MNNWEYQNIQRLLDDKLKKNPYKHSANYKKAEGYEAGILAAKSILSNWFKHGGAN